MSNALYWGKPSMSNPPPLAPVVKGGFDIANKVTINIPWALTRQLSKIYSGAMVLCEFPLYSLDHLCPKVDGDSLEPRPLFTLGGGKRVWRKSGDCCKQAANSCFLHLLQISLMYPDHYFSPPPRKEK